MEHWFQSFLIGMLTSILLTRTYKILYKKTVVQILIIKIISSELLIDCLIYVLYVASLLFYHLYKRKCVKNNGPCQDTHITILL